MTILYNIYIYFYQLYKQDVIPLKKRKKTSGTENFENYYRELIGPIWDELKAGFGEETLYHTIESGLLKPYYMDTASVYPVKALKIKPGSLVLDMCAAPGGKTLLAALDNGPEGKLTANDRSPDRRGRLKKVIEEHLPEELRKTVSITGYDASKWGLYEKNIYDRILLDAPCSSERHVYNSPPHLEKWSISRTKRLSERQFAMLAAALEAVKPGGRIVYSTCSVSDLENDRIIEKLFKKRNGIFKIIQDEDQGEAEPTEFGYRIWPNKKPFAGPIFYTIISKTDEGAFHEKS